MFSATHQGQKALEFKFNFTATKQKGIKIKLNVFFSYSYVAPNIQIHDYFLEVNESVEQSILVRPSNVFLQDVCQKRGRKLISLLTHEISRKTNIFVKSN